MNARRWSAHLLLGVSATASGCAPTLPEVPRGTHPLNGGSVPFVVDSEPPPVMIENVGTPASDDCLWADGYWSYGAGSWRWNPGRWVRDLDDCYFAEPSLVWVAAVTQHGALFYTEGQWYHRQSGQPCPSPSECRAQ